jgi:capsular polysaccharide transport system permease protein
MLTGTVPDSDPRIAQINRRIEVIQKRMAEEQSKVGGLSDPGAPNYAKLVTQYQNLQMEQDFAQKTYLAALGAYDQAVNDAQHKTRYLATYLEPTLAETSTAPMRLLRIFLTALIGSLAWSIVTMIYYALRDRR